MKKINILLILFLFAINAAGQNFIQKELDSRYIYDLTPQKFKSHFNIENDTIQMDNRNLFFFDMSSGYKVSYLPFYIPKGKFFAIITFMRNKIPIYESISDEISKPFPVIYDPSGVSTAISPLKINEAKEHHLSIALNSSYNHYQNGKNVSYEIYYTPHNRALTGKYYFSYVFFDPTKYQNSKHYYNDMFIGYYLFDTENELIKFIDSMKNKN